MPLHLDATLISYVNPFIFLAPGGNALDTNVDLSLKSTLRDIILLYFNTSPNKVSMQMKSLRTKLSSSFDMNCWYTAWPTLSCGGHLSWTNMTFLPLSREDPLSFSPTLLSFLSSAQTRSLPCWRWQLRMQPPSWFPWKTSSWLYHPASPSTFTVRIYQAKLILSWPIQSHGDPSPLINRRIASTYRSVD